MIIISLETLKSLVFIIANCLILITVIAILYIWWRTNWWARENAFINSVTGNTKYSLGLHYNGDENYLYVTKT